MNRDKLDQYIERNLKRDSSDQTTSEDKISVDQSDIFDKAFRLGLSLICSAFLTGIGAGIIESYTGLTIEFGGPILATALINTIPFWLLFSKVGPFKKKFTYIDKP